MFSHIFGNEPIKAYLQKALTENSLPQTLLFSGLEGIGKSLFAKALAAHLLKADPQRIAKENHPDLHMIRPEGKSGVHAIDALREMIGKGQSSPFEAPAHLFIIEDAHRMQPAAANALLKTLEEPGLDTAFILLASSPREMLPTVLSRCAHLHFQPLSEPHVASLLQSKGCDPRFAKFSSGSIGQALELASSPDTEEQRKILFQILRQRPSYPELSKQLQILDEFLEKEEDPVRLNRRIEHLFSLILMWTRDQHLQKIGADPALLFFPEEPLLSASSSAPSLKQLEIQIDEARSAYQKNIKLSVCLSKLFLF